ncbi:YrhB domain-containing protein [Kitasatospora purpeofusca]|uniref:YrhB domain-containing protein n=1 Tax=Kitasatospora purpeofusca TaxID=67352 RepID=UPI0036C6F9AF
MLPGMIDREYARRTAQEDLDRIDPGRLVVSDVEEHELVWIVSYQTAEYLRTRDPRQLLGGNGPYLVDRVDGGLHALGSASDVNGGAWEDDYRRRIRKELTCAAVDDLHEELRRATAEQGRIIAMRLLRQRVPSLTHAQVVEYVTALRAGAVPDHLVAAAREELVPPVHPADAVETIRPGRTPWSGVRTVGP